MLEIADNSKKDETPFVGINHVHRDKLRTDVRKWMLSKMVPKKYGDKLDLTSEGEKIEVAPIILKPLNKDE